MHLNNDFHIRMHFPLLLFVCCSAIQQSEQTKHAIVRSVLGGVTNESSVWGLLGEEQHKLGLRGREDTFHAVFNLDARPNVLLDKMANLGYKVVVPAVNARESSRLFEDLLSGYDKLVRPGKSPSDAIEIQFKFKLVQILDVHEKNQVLTTKGALIHRWTDQRLAWEPNEYGQVTMLHIPGELIWVPDIILYNNAHGSPTIAAITKADVYANGSVFWEPPVVYNSMCAIDIKWFPYDEQECYMKFGSWTYGGFELDMVHLDTDIVEHISQQNGTIWNVELGVDISEYQESVEFELLSVNGRRHEKRYPCCDYPVIDITYYLKIRRKKLFYTVNLMIPCVGIAILTSFVFYLPSQSHNKVNLCINILVSLTVFFLLLIEIIPPTSLTTPLIGKYLIFTMCMVTASVTVTVIVENIHYRNAAPMPPLVRHVFIGILGRHYHRPSSPLAKRRRIEKKLPSLNALRILESHFSEMENLGRERDGGEEDEGTQSEPNLSRQHSREYSPHQHQQQQQQSSSAVPPELRLRVQRMGHNIRYIEQTVRRTRRNNDLHSDWMFVALVRRKLTEGVQLGFGQVLDRIMLAFFSTTILAGTLYTWFSAPSLTDHRIPITTRYPPNPML